MSSDGTNDHAHAANGSVGTIDFETGTINGESNGHANGHSNGYSNIEANGHSNGHTNGHSNGYSNIEANGHSNGHANGHANGYSNIEANGHSNGHANGGDAQVDAANGATNDHSVAPEAGRYTKIPGPLGIESASLKGKVALVTGAGRGIGREMALELGRRGAKVVVNYANSDEAAMEAVAEIKRCGSEAIAVKANVSVVKDIISLFAQAKAHFGELNIVCSNSGVVSFGHIGEVTEEEYDRVMGINTRGQFFVAREAYRHLSIGGRLIMMGSITGQAKGVPKHTLYSGSKGAIETFVRCMAIDMGDKKITVNCIAPGGIKTDMYHKVCREYIPGGEELSDDGVDEYAATWSPLHRVGLPIDIARVVCFLASQDGEWVNGKVIGIDGAACM